MRAVDGTEADWRRELNSQFLQALGEKLFAPMEGRMPAGRTSRVAGRLYRPTIYNIVRGPAVGPVLDDAAETVRLPRW